ncbi:MAG TPA: O-antigen ligase family protein [Xanthomonadales bacterium]|nr:O-antigen ligase family protein [Xanthomonadales bacterium]
MKKLLKWHDKYTLKILVSFLILFTALYPKLPSIHIMRTWVYIRLEDFFILATVLIWFIQLLRRKVSLPRVFAGSIGAYWLIGLISLVYSILVIGPTLIHYFPHLAALSYIRRIEYMILFFVAFSTIRTKKDVRDYFIVLASTVGLVALYGLGQRYYVILWAAFPSFFQSNPFCFPSFQTGNEEFAKGLPLCLPPGGRTTSTFGGSYDLGAYLVMVLPVVIGVFVTIKKLGLKILTFFVFLAGLMLLIFTAQRAAFVAYLVGSIFTLFIYKRKIFIIPLIIISIFSLSIFSEATAKRFLSTFRISSIVTNSQGQLVGEALPAGLKSKFQKPRGGEYLPSGSAYIGLPQEKTLETDTAMIKKTLTPQEARRLKLADGTLQISTVSGSFLVRKVLVYDISFTTRFQAEWPNALRAFQRNPILGSGYSTITLATDNDYLRALGETGILGLLSFMGIFLMLWITLCKLGPSSKPSMTAGFAYGLAGGVLGLALNAVLIDVFEASKVAESLWILLGISVGSLLLYKQKPIPYMLEVKKIFTSSKALIAYLAILVIGAFSHTVTNFFVADDFTWLKWAATDTLQSLPNHFLNAQNFFYRPLVKIITFFLYTLFSFQPQGYHSFIIFLHLLSTVAVFCLAKKILNDKFHAFCTAVLFALLPVHSENIMWFSGLSGVLATLLILGGTVSFLRFRLNNSKVSLVISFILTALALASYEIAVVAPLLYLAVDALIVRRAWSKKNYLIHIPFLALIPLYYLLRIFSNAFPGGGDYSYNLIRIVPNFIGNFLGYIGLFIAGNGFLPFYDNLRNTLRSQSSLFTIVLLVVFCVLGYVGYAQRRKAVSFLKKDISRQIIFGIVFAAISLLPFLGLGNIAPRYLYLGSFGFCFSLVVGLSAISKLIVGKRRIDSKWVVVVIVLGLSVWYQLENIEQGKKWKKAGEITADTLAYLRVEHENIKATDSTYFVNVPVKHDGIWVFPVGLNDGMWFIYRDRTPHVYQVNSVDDAKKAVTTRSGKSYLFRYDKFGNISQVK